MKNRPLVHTSKYALPKETFLTAVHYALQYPEIAQELAECTNTIKALSYSDTNSKGGGTYDAVSETAIKRAALSKRRKLIEDTARAAGQDIYSYLLTGVAEGETYDQLAARGMPCGKDYYYSRRRKFYWLLSQRI